MSSEGNLAAATEHSRTLHHQVPAATEHRQVTETSANIVLVNIDWKESRMHNTLSTNMSKLKDMIKGVVKKMQPTMICMCEVGEAGRPLSMLQMQQVADFFTGEFDVNFDVELDVKFGVKT